MSGANFTPLDSKLASLFYNIGGALAFAGAAQLLKAVKPSFPSTRLAQVKNWLRRQGRTAPTHHITHPAGGPSWGEGAPPLHFENEMNIMIEWMPSDVATKHKFSGGARDRPHYFSSAPGDELEIDLIDMRRFRGSNGWCLVAVDVYSRYVRARPLKRKDTEAVLAALTSILDQMLLVGVKPNSLHSDREKAFTSQPVRRLLEVRKIELYLAMRTPKAAMA